MVLKRLGAIIGYAGHKNEVIYSSGVKLVTNELTCYFGGDIQNYPEVMESSHKEHGKFNQWNILATVSLLATKFPQNVVLGILPSRFEMNTFSCYDNFVTSDKLGSPSHTPMSTGSEHLKLLIENSFSQSGESSNTVNSACSEVNSSCLNLNSIDAINLIGFSKGCVVLNQLIRDFHTISSITPNFNLLTFWNKVKNIYWLDGAHSGGKDTWVVDESVLTSLASSDIRVHVHLTPYQMEDNRRPWIRKECTLFVSRLRKAGCNVSQKIHFKDMPASLNNHFQVLDSFKQSED